MKVAEATVAFLGEYSGLEKDVAAGAQPAANKLGGIFQQAMKSAFSQKLEIGGALLTGVGAWATALSEPIEKAQVTLEQAIKNTGKSWDDYKGQIDAAIKKGEDFGHGAADTQTALTKLVTATQDPAKALQLLNSAEKAAAFLGIPVADAAKQITLAEQGKGRLYAQLGITIPKVTDYTKEAAKADKAHTVAVDELTKAQRRLDEMHVSLAAKKKVSALDSMHLADAEKAVADAQGKVTTTAAAGAAIQTAAAHQTDRLGTAMDTLNKRLDGYAERQSQTFGGQLLAAKTRLGDFAGMVGGKVGPALIMVGPLMTGVGGAMQLLSTFTGAHTAATAADTVAVGANTGVGLLGRIGMLAGSVATGIMTAAQWALNVALDANPIGLVVIAIAGLIGILILAYTHVTPVRDAINWLWNEIQILWHWIMGGSPGLVPAFQELISIIGTVISVALLPIKLEFTLLSAAVGAVWSVLQGVGGWLAGTFGGILSGTIGTIGNIVSTISGEFGRLPGLLAAIGGQIIGGLISGLLGGIGGIAGAVGQVAGSVVSGFKGLLGIHSPSTVFADQVGGPIVEGIGMGITKSGAAHRALAGLHLTAPNIGGIAAGNMSLSALSGAAAGGKAGGIHVGAINITNPIAEPASTSTARELRKLAYLGQAT